MSLAVSYQAPFAKVATDATSLASEASSSEISLVDPSVVAKLLPKKDSIVGKVKIKKPPPKPKADKDGEDESWAFVHFKTDPLSVQMTTPSHPSHPLSMTSTLTFEPPSLTAAQWTIKWTSYNASTARER